MDGNLDKEKKEYKSAEIIKTIGGFITIGADMRGDALLSPSRYESFQFPIKMNANIKNSVWLASEYAGRETRYAWGRNRHRQADKD